MASPLRILLVEDDLHDAELLLREIRRAGFESSCQRVETEEDYLAQLTAEIDIVISDYRLPAFSGVRALELLKERLPEVPFLLVSGTIGEEMAVEIMKQGAQDYLLKDRLARLGQAIEHALAESRLRKERRTANELLALRERALGEVSQGVIICDEHRHIIYANPSFASISGYEQDEILGKKCSILQGPGTDPATIVRIRTALDAHLPFEGEILNYRKDGTPFWNELALTPFRDNRRGPIKFIGVQRDITDRKVASEALKKSEENLRRERAQLRALIDSIPDLIFFKDTNSVFLGCNKAFEEYAGIKESDLVGKTDFDVARETARSYRAYDQEMLASGKPLMVEEWIFGKEGGGYFETIKTPYYNIHGESLGIVGVSRDMTDRRRAEDKLRAALDRLQLAAEASQSGIWELDAVKNEATWDDQMYAIYGLERTDRKEGVDRWFQVMPQEDIDRCQAIFEEALHAGREFFDLEFSIRRANDGSTRIIRSMGAIKRDVDGNFIRMIGINHDVTGERTRERELAEALAHEKELSEKAIAGEQAKREFLAAMSHELRTPMNGILGFAELLDESAAMPEALRPYSRTIMQSGEALLRILDDILDFSRLEAGQLRIEPMRYSPNKLASDVCNLLLRQAQEKDIQLEIAIAESTPKYLIGDAGRIRQVLVNLVGNAIKFTDYGSVRIQMEAMRENDLPRLEILVTDTGTGIETDKLEAIFDPFTQADSSISRRFGGTGLGLTITRRLVELLGGRISVWSELGRGSEFRVILPLCLPEASSGTEASAQAELLATDFARKYSMRVLIVEDDKINLRLIQALLRRLGYEPLVAHNGQEALSVYATAPIDCILMDLQMPEMDGIEATRMIREIEDGTDHKAYIFALTANTVPTDKQKCFDAGMNEYLNKPVRMNALAALLIKAHTALSTKSESSKPSRITVR